MKKSRMKVELRPSKLMDERARNNPNEHDFIRMPRRARDYYSPQGISIRAFMGGREKDLEVRQAIRDDIRRIKKGEAPVQTVGFVTTKTYEQITSKASAKNVWLSEHITDLVLGSDPEFGLIVTKEGEDGLGELKYASHAYNVGRGHPLGHDGPAMELRPAPVPKVDEHTENIRKLLEKAYKDERLNRYEWFTGALFKCKHRPHGYVFGGHIHVGNPRILTEVVNKQEDPGLEEDVHRRMVRLLDDVVGLPLTRIDGPSAGLRREGKPRDNYGRFGSFRKQQNRFEWRTPSAIWMTDPLLTKAVLGVVKAVSEAAYDVLTDWGFDRERLRVASTYNNSFLHHFGCRTDDYVKKALHKSSFSTFNDEEMKDLHKRLKVLSTYKKYKDEIDLFIRITSVPAEKVKSGMNFFGMKEAWMNDKRALAL